jgi:hypothetical protein
VINKDTNRVIDLPPTSCCSPTPAPSLCACCSERLCILLRLAGDEATSRSRLFTTTTTCDLVTSWYQIPWLMIMMPLRLWHNRLWTWWHPWVRWQPDLMRSTSHWRLSTTACLRCRRAQPHWRSGRSAMGYLRLPWGHLLWRPLQHRTSRALTLTSTTSHLVSTGLNFHDLMASRTPWVGSNTVTNFFVGKRHRKWEGLAFLLPSHRHSPAMVLRIGAWWRWA